MEINGEKYVKVSEINQEKLGQVYAQEHDGMKYVIIRADRAGVFAGYLKKQEGDTVVMVNCRRLWYWDGAASISQIAIDGVSKPEDCKFPAEVNLMIYGVVEIIDATEKARLSIKDVPVWKE